jgi:tRNA (cytidine/uridine-2'-O-)-methyltransferase
LQIVLVHPEIPQNTGCAARLSAALGLPLHLVEPLGFSLDEKRVRRAGLDYWPEVDLTVHRDWAALRASLGSGSDRRFTERVRAFTARGGTSLFAADFEPDDLLVFGSESKGLPPELLADGARRVYIPIRERVRSLNLANAVSVAAYTAMLRAGLPLPENDGRWVPRE